MIGNSADEYFQQLFPGGIVQLGSQKVRVTRWEVDLPDPLMCARNPYDVFEPTVRFEGVFVTPQLFFEGDPEMSCGEERPFEYMIINRGSGETGPQMPASIIVDRTSVMAKSPEDAKTRALYRLALKDAAENSRLRADGKPQFARELESLEVLVRPFPG